MREVESSGRIRWYDDCPYTRVRRDWLGRRTEQDSDMKMRWRVEEGVKDCGTDTRVGTNEGNAMSVHRW